MIKWTIKLVRPDDSGEYYSQTVSFGGDYSQEYGNVYVHPDRKSKSPIQDSLSKSFSLALKGKSTQVRQTSTPMPLMRLDSQPRLFDMGGFPVVLSKTSSQYSLNGKTMTLKRISDILARLTYKSIFEKDKGVMMKYLLKLQNMPENISYVLENRFPYFFYEDFNRIDVFMNVIQIGEDECAIEIADGVWGNISFGNLNTMCNFYIHGKKRGNWKYLSPQELFRRTVGHEPLDSDVKVMINFLKQNRQKDIVEKRAAELMKELSEQYPNRIKITEEKGRAVMFVRGNGFDWKLIESTYKSEIQQVTTMVWQPMMESKEEDGEVEMTYSEPLWRGPICIDNMARGSSVGDQFVARALALLNDSMTVKIVNTIRRYLTADENKFRIDWNEV